MRVKEKNNTTLYQFELPAFESVTSFVTTRHNATRNASARGDFNLGLYCGDDTERVEANLHQLCSALDIQRNQLFYPHQVHGCEVCVIDSDFIALPRNDQLNALDGVDAIITNLPEVAIAVTTADCVPVVLYDPVHRAIAVIHAGWRGTAQEIVRHAIKAMNCQYGTQASEIYAGIGPCIGIEAYEVGDEVVDAMRNAGIDIITMSIRNK
ncbi:MAG: laccase domain-containing protein, partial [Bacteroidales bacterium]|nr:laccase domain-containing protein [Bacteroidales bacterium]